MKSSQRFCRVHEHAWGLHNELISKNTMQFIADHCTMTVGSRKRERKELAAKELAQGPIGDIRVFVAFSAWSIRLSTQLPQIVAQDNEFTHSFA